MKAERKFDFSKIIEQFKKNCPVILNKGERKFSDDIIVIVMSRKMVRLLDWILSTDGSIEIPYPIITEHAIPFYFPKYRDKQIVVLDDSMFYGATLHNVRQVLQWCNGTEANIKFFPIVARNRMAAEELGIKFTDTYHIPEEEVPLNTYINATCMLSLNSPMEVEYPILSFEREEDNLEDITDVELVLKKHFRNSEVYTVTHQLYIKKNNYNLPNYTVLLKPSGDSYSYDFAKFRIYIDSKTLKIVPIAPIVLSNDVLNSDVLSIFKESGFQELWDGVKKRLCIIQDVSLDISEIEKDEIAKEYELRKNKSLAVWANYLASYSKLLEYRKELNSFLEEIEYIPLPSFEKKDISILIGHSEIDGNSITEMLSDLYEWGINSIHKPRNNSYKWDNYIPLPPEYETIYQKRNAAVWSRCKSITQALSYMISNQHYYVNKAFNELSPKRIEKSRFGVTFPYLLTELCNYGEERDKSKQLLHIHHWIDKKIDEGTVVPKFEQRYQKDTDTYYWRRYFKSGENEDSLLQIVRVCSYIYCRIRKFQQADYVKRRVFEELAITLFCNFDGKFNWGYSLSDSFTCRWNKETSEWRLLYYDEILKQSYLLIDELLCAQSYFQLEKVGGYECVFLNENGMTDFLGKAVSLDGEACKRLDDYVLIYLGHTDSFTTCFNLFRTFNEDDSTQSLKEFSLSIRNFFKSLLITEKIEDKMESVNQYTKSLDTIYYQTFVPEVPLSSIPDNLNNLDLFFSLSNKSNKSRPNNQKLNDILFKWELFLAIYIDNDMEQALLILSFLESHGLKLDDISNTLMKYNHIGEITSDVKNALLRRIRSLF